MAQIGRKHYPTITRKRMDTWKAKPKPTTADKMFGKNTSKRMQGVNKVVDAGKWVLGKTYKAVTSPQAKAAGKKIGKGAKGFLEGWARGATKNYKI